jgi:hypothetical protein
MYRPVASQAVAIQNTASWVCQVRVTAYGIHSEIGMP